MRISSSGEIREARRLAVGERMEEAAAHGRDSFASPEQTREELIAFRRGRAAGATGIRERACGSHVDKPEPPSSH